MNVKSIHIAWTEHTKKEKTKKDKRRDKNTKSKPKYPPPIRDALTWDIYAKQTHLDIKSFSFRMAQLSLFNRPTQNGLGMDFMIFPFSRKKL